MLVSRLWIWYCLLWVCSVVLIVFKSVMGWKGCFSIVMFLMGLSVVSWCNWVWLVLLLFVINMRGIFD